MISLRSRRRALAARARGARSAPRQLLRAAVRLPPRLRRSHSSCARRRSLSSARPVVVAPRRGAQEGRASGVAAAAIARRRGPRRGRRGITVVIGVRPRHPSRRSASATSTSSVSSSASRADPARAARPCFTVDDGSAVRRSRAAIDCRRSGRGRSVPPAHRTFAAANSQETHGHEWASETSAS